LIKVTFLGFLKSKCALSNLAVINKRLQKQNWKTRLNALSKKSLWRECYYYDYLWSKSGCCSIWGLCQQIQPHLQVVMQLCYQTDFLSRWYESLGYSAAPFSCCCHGGFWREKSTNS
jgi:hypothetical protein